MILYLVLNLIMSQKDFILYTSVHETNDQKYKDWIQLGDNVHRRHIKAFQNFFCPTRHQQRPKL